MGIQKTDIPYGSMKLFPEFSYGYMPVIPADPPYGISSRNRFSGSPHLRIIGDGETNYEHFARENYRRLKNNFHAYFSPALAAISIISATRSMRGQHGVEDYLVVEKRIIDGIGELYGSCANDAKWLPFCRKWMCPFNPANLLKDSRKKVIKNTKPGIIPAGLVTNIPKPLITPHGRNKTIFIIPRSKMRNAVPG